MAGTVCPYLFFNFHLVHYFIWHFNPNSVKSNYLLKSFKLLRSLQQCCFAYDNHGFCHMLCRVKLSCRVNSWPSRGIVEIVGISEDCSVTSLPNEIIQRTVGFAGLNCARLVLSLIKPAPTCDDEMFSWWKRQNVSNVEKK